MQSQASKSGINKKMNIKTLTMHAALWAVLISAPQISSAETIVGDESEMFIDWGVEKGSGLPGKDVADAFADELITGAREVALSLKPVYEKMQTCQEAESDYLKVFGMQDNLCHFRYAYFDCLVHLETAKEFADLGLKGIEEVFKGNLSTQSTETNSVHNILSNKDYCTLETPEPSFSITDENGYEIENIAEE